MGSGRLPEQLDRLVEAIRVRRVPAQVTNEAVTEIVKRDRQVAVRMSPPGGDGPPPVADGLAR